MFKPALVSTEQASKGLCFAFSGRRLLVGESFEILSFHRLDLPRGATKQLHYLGTLDGVPCSCLDLGLGFEPPPGSQLLELTQLISVLDGTVFAAAGRAIQILDWDRNHRFCGACGSPTSPLPDSRARRCQKCPLTFFPRLTPAVIVAVTRGDEILMARPPKGPPGIYALVAGFVEPGETLEEAVEREVLEETGLTVRNIRYSTSQPWPFPGSIMIGFTAEYGGGEITLDPTELEDARFFRADAMPPMFPGKFTISQWLIADFLRLHGRELT